MSLPLQEKPSELQASLPKIRNCSLRDFRDFPDSFKKGDFYLASIVLGGVYNRPAFEQLGFRVVYESPWACNLYHATRSPKNSIKLFIVEKL